MREKLVRDVMRRNVVCCPLGCAAKEVARLLATNDANVVVVLDEMAEACGIITPADLLPCYGKNLEIVRAETVMTPHVVTISPTASLTEAAALMLSQGMRQLVVPKGEPAGMRPVGILSVEDIVREMAR